MGYYTDFTLKIEGPEEDIEAMRNSDYLSQTDYGPLFENFYHSKGGLYMWGDVKWYEYPEDMLEISKRNPTLFFTLWGDGEEESDLWVSYFYQGQHEHFKAQITYPKPTIKVDA